MDYNRFICEISKKRECNFLRLLIGERAKGQNGISKDAISFGGGLPNTDTFPFESMKIKLKDGNELTLEGKKLGKALQYGASEGALELREWIFRLQKKYHDPPLLRENNLGLLVTVGSQDGLAKTFNTLLSPGDNVLVEELLYPGTLAVVKPLPINLLSVEIDGDGIKPDSLLKVLSKWKPEDAKNPNSDIPKVLYTVPNGGNPSGCTATTERKKKIYEIARLYDLIIIEDDPYYFLQFEQLAPSYQSMDVDGRVIRGDSMSKVIAAGLRLGWMTGAKALIERLTLDQQSNVMHSSMLSQVLTLNLFEHWKLDGFEKHINSIQRFYQSQRDVMITSASRWLTGIAEWNVPRSGLYLWVRFTTLTDTMKQLFKQALGNGVVVVPGKVFLIKEGMTSEYCRLSYSCATPEEIDQGMKKIAEVLRGHAT